MPYLNHRKKCLSILFHKRPGLSWRIISKEKEYDEKILLRANSQINLRGHLSVYELSNTELVQSNYRWIYYTTRKVRPISKSGLSEVNGRSHINVHSWDVRSALSQFEPVSVTRHQQWAWSVQSTAHETWSVTYSMGNRDRSNNFAHNSSKPAEELWTSLTHHQKLPYNLMV